MKNILASTLNHKIIFLHNISDSEIDDPNWIKNFSSHAEIKPMYDNKFGSIENFSFGLIVTEAFFMFKIRFSKKIHMKMRIQFQSRLFEIKRIINPGERNICLKIIALEICKHAE